jgi:hypothetical protein
MVGTTSRSTTTPVTSVAAQFPDVLRGKYRSLRRLNTGYTVNDRSIAHDSGFTRGAETRYDRQASATKMKRKAMNHPLDVAAGSELILAVPFFIALSYSR